MTSAHLFFIPLVLLVGAGAGYLLGRKLLLAEQDEARRLRQRRDQAAAAERSAATAERSAAAGEGSAAPDGNSARN